MGTTPPPHQPHYSLTKKLIKFTIYLLIPLTLLHLYLSPFSPPPSQELTDHVAPTQPQCDYSNGKWVPTTLSPLYNGTSCATIKDGQNCQAHGRPDTSYLHYRWKPLNCQLSVFNPLAFLRSTRNRHLAFVGDSMARNQLESLLCLLSSASSPELVFTSGDDNKFRTWIFRHFNVTVSVYWSPFLVNGTEKSQELNHNLLYLDTADTKWAKDVPKLDIIVFSVGHWFLHPAVFYENGKVLGCHQCDHNHTEIGFFDVFRKAVGTSLKKVNSLDERKLVVLTTFSPAHFEGEWDKFGACAKKEPYKEGEKEMEYMDAEMRKIEVEEIGKVAESGGKVRFRALDVTRLAMLRPDGHPGPYMYPNPFADGVKERVQNDCVHWCLPGPIDTWNEILLEIVKRGKYW